MRPDQDLTMFDAGYDTHGNESGLRHTIRRILSDIARPDRQRSIDLAKAGHNYFLMESDAMDDGARLPYRPY